MNEPIAMANAVIIALTVVVSYLGLQNPPFTAYYLFSSKDIVEGKEYYRILTSGFFHADWAHLLFNMFSLWSFGRYIELIFGSWFFLVIYIAGILGGNLVSLVLHRHEPYRALGASGGVCGIIFASIFLLPGGSVMMFFIPYPIPSWLFAILFVLFSFYGARNQLGNIGHDAHLGGAIIGLLLTTILKPSIVTESPLLYAAIMGITLAVIIGMQWKRLQQKR